jgi:hypothetical protein
MKHNNASSPDKNLNSNNKGVNDYDAGKTTNKSKKKIIINFHKKN